MPRYIVERTFVDGLAINADADGAKTCVGVADANSSLGVTWIHSYFTTDHTLSYCIYDAPSPEAIRLAAERNGLPVNRITEVRVLDPYFFH